jgi:predicted Zn-dependent protease
MRLSTKGFLTTLLLLLAVVPSAAAETRTPDDAGKDDVLLQALTTELKRSVKGLQAAESPAPLYFLGYQAREGRRYSLGASMGAISHEGDEPLRTLDVDVRVGARELDNTHQLKGRGGRFEFPNVRYTDLPVDDDAAALRAVVWLETERAFKEALTRFTKVQTNKAVTATEEDASPDFSIEEPSRFYSKVDFPALDKAEWRDRLRKISATLKSYPFIYRSTVSLNVQTDNRYVVNSEGTRVVDGTILVRLSYTLSSLTEDGMDLRRSSSYDAADPADLPAAEQVLEDLKRSASELQALLEAPLVEPYTGPAIIRNRATAVFFHEILGHRLEGHRQKLEMEGQTFTKMLGKPVVAEFISVYDDPTIDNWDGQFLRGFYHFDDEGIPAQRVTLVDSGILKGFLMGRSPIEHFPNSNGHGRRSAGRFPVSRMGNTIVEAAETVTYERLREMLIEEVREQGKPYGYVFDDISGGFTTTRRAGPQSFKVIPHLVYRVYADGRPDETVRGVDIVGTPLTSFGKIAAAADDYAVFNGTCGAESGWVPVAGVAPSVLVTEIEIEKKFTMSEKPPILPPPFHAKGEQP